MYRLVKLYDAQGRYVEARKWAGEILNKPVKIPSPTVSKIRKEMQQFLIQVNDRIEQENIQMCNEGNRRRF